VLLPVKRITEVCHRHDVIVIIDAAHAPGQLHVDIQDIDADFYTGEQIVLGTFILFFVLECPFYLKKTKQTVK
jgi:7-keto-8-aminopelargonate synthetase-like enzyme